MKNEPGQKTVQKNLKNIKLLMKCMGHFFAEVVEISSFDPIVVYL